VEIIVASKASEVNKLKILFEMDFKIIVRTSACSERKSGMRDISVDFDLINVKQCGGQMFIAVL